MAEKQECPACRKTATEGQLRPNPVLEEVITAWKLSRYILGLETVVHFKRETIGHTFSSLYKRTSSKGQPHRGQTLPKARRGNSCPINRAKVGVAKVALLIRRRSPGEQENSLTMMARRPFRPPMQTKMRCQCYMLTLVVRETTDRSRYMNAPLTS